MGWGTGNLGGGSGGLNFKIVSYATKSELLADTPKENTIGVITSIPITGYHFGTEEPSPAAAGMVWITTGTSSQAAFNALKKNGIQVYPISAKQYVSGSWVDVTAKSYQNGEWVDWIRENVLYDTGDQNELITGGWVSKAIGISGHTVTAPTVTYSKDALIMESGNGIVCCENKIDLSKYVTLYFDGTITSANAVWCRMCVWSELGTKADINISAEKRFGSGTHEGEQTLDVSSLSGKYYVGFLLDKASATMRKMWLE